MTESDFSSDSGDDDRKKKLGARNERESSDVDIRSRKKPRTEEEPSFLSNYGAHGQNQLKKYPDKHRSRSRSKERMHARESFQSPPLKRSKQDYRSYQRRSPSRERRRSRSLERRRHKDSSRSPPTREKSQKMHHRRHRSRSSSEERTSQPHKDNKKSHHHEEPRTYSRSKERGRYK